MYSDQDAGEQKGRSDGRQEGRHAEPSGSRIEEAPQDGSVQVEKGRVI